MEARAQSAPQEDRRAAAASAFDHEEVRAVRGPRSGWPIIVAIHSTRLGNAAGGCRLWSYDSWRDGLVDACRLAETMTYKFAFAGLPIGGGKSVIALPPGVMLSTSGRRDVMLDLGDVVESFAGRYRVGEDVGTTPEDMLVASGRTSHVACLPAAVGGSGDPAEPTATGVYECILRACSDALGWSGPGGHTFCIIGLGHVGERIARRLAAAGARLVASDIDPGKKAIASELGAGWVEADAALSCQCDVLVPSALGGFLSAATVPTLRCRAIIGPANSQLADESAADLLAARGILWGPDYLVNAGGAVYVATLDVLGGDAESARARMHAVADAFGEVLACSQREGVTPLTVARRVARNHLGLA